MPPGEPDTPRALARPELGTGAAVDPAGRLLDATAYVGFVLLFPVFILYHYAVVSGWIPALAGGMFGVCAAAISLFGLLHIAANLTVVDGRVPLLERAFLFVVLYLTLWTIAASVLAADRAYSGPAVTEALATLTVWLAAYFIAVRLRVSARRTWPSLLLLVALIVLCFGHAIVAHGSFVGPFLAFQGETASQGASSTYQGVGRAILVIAVVVSSLQHRLWSQLQVLGASAFMLVALGSRAHLFAVLLLIAVQLLLFGFRRGNLWTGVFVLIAAVGTGYLTWDLFLSTRAGEIFALGQSTSWQARIAANEEAVEVIQRNPFLGEFGYHMSDRSAGYAHNLLSAWAGLGGVSFLLYFGLILWALTISGSRVLVRRKCPAVWRIAFQFNFVALLLGLASEPIYLSVFPALGWGFAVAGLSDDRNRRHLVAG